MACYYTRWGLVYISFRRQLLLRRPSKKSWAGFRALLSPAVSRTSASPLSFICKSRRSSPSLMILFLLIISTDVADAFFMPRPSAQHVAYASPARPARGAAATRLAHLEKKSAMTWPDIGHLYGASCLDARRRPAAARRSAIYATPHSLSDFEASRHDDMMLWLCAARRAQPATRGP